VSAPFSVDALTMTGDGAPPRDNGELVFNAPWEGRVFALAVALVDRLDLEWDDFRQRLITAIADDPERPYYESWAAALEALVVDLGLTTAAVITASEPSERAPL
jgi:nitrile hydratase accessory protein